MAGHANQITVQATSGVETGGLLISGELREYVWPGLTDEQLVDQIGFFLKETLRVKLIGMQTTMIGEDARQLVEDGTTDIS